MTLRLSLDPRRLVASHPVRRDRGRARYLIQFDTASKTHPYRVLSLSGASIGHFAHERDAVRFCELAPAGLDADEVVDPLAETRPWKLPAFAEVQS